MEISGGTREKRKGEKGKEGMKRGVKGRKEAGRKADDRKCQKHE